ncbi:hypothetical protein L1987_64877 [Smallanthus sonchifolius]|uniref:Uncharacterized protein n=1 Tax=Smallanthus sonchifolius TaxID=185202 RepID=A0ACB9BSS2_9ASTR|nr:hypothetical protein L1987_64877 [Smallanthus sonchifolius]
MESLFFSKSSPTWRSDTKCVAAKGDDASECQKFAKFYSIVLFARVNGWTSGMSRGRMGYFQALCDLI